MNQSSRQLRLRRRAEEALARSKQARAESQRRHGQPPHPGDLFVLADTAQDVLQWAVIDCQPDQLRVLVTAVDHHPAIGSADIAVPPGDTRGALSLRCQFGIWIAAEALAPDLRTGFLESEVVERVLSKRAEIARGSLKGSAVERATDTEPEYQDLQEGLEQALARLRERRAQPAERVGEVVPFRPGPSRWVSFSSPYAMAASVLLFVTLGLGSGLVWSEWLDRQRTAALSPVVDLPFVWLSPQAETRGEIKTLLVSDDSSFLLLILEINNPEPFSKYRLEIRDKSTDAEVYSSEFSKTGLAELSLALPRHWIDVGEYQLRLYGLGTEEDSLVEEYALRIEFGDSP